MALLLVTVVMALAAILGYAMLSSSTLQATASSNGVAGAIANAQAETGISLAMYYLQNASNAPSQSNGYWPGASNITFTPTGGTTMPGSVTVTVSKATSPANTYNITSVGSSGTSVGGGVVTKTLSAVVRVNTSYLINQAMGSNVAMTIPAGAVVVGNTVTHSAITTNKAVTIASGAHVTGNISATSLTQRGTLNGSLVPAPTEEAAPSSADIHNYTTYTYQGATYSAQLLSTATLNSTTLGPDATINPLGVFWYNGSVTLQNNVKMNGTLIVKNGKITVAGTGNVITAAANMPGLVVDQSLVMNAGKALTVNGVVWLGQGLSGSGVGSTANLTINGGLLTDTGAITTYTGALNLTYSSANSTVPDLSSANQTPMSTQIVSWTP